MIGAGRAATVAVIYFVAAVSMIAYELSVRLLNSGNSEFAGMLSFALTLPSSIAVAAASSGIAGVRVGDSDATFVVILTVAAIVNALLIFVAIRRLGHATSAARKKS